MQFIRHLSSGGGGGELFAGFPVALCTNLANAATLRLDTDVQLADGVVRVALTNVAGAFQVWLPEHCYLGPGGLEDLIEIPAVKLLDSEAQRERHFTMRQWRDLVRRHAGGGTRSVCVKILSSEPGHCDLDFAYALDYSNTAIKSNVRRRITSVTPPLLPGYDRDGGIGANDVAAFLRGEMFRYWLNECRISGDVWEERSLFEGIAESLAGPENWRNNHVDGRYDLINLFPVAVAAEPFINAWRMRGAVAVKFTCPEGLDCFRFTFANIARSEAGAMRTAPRQNTASQPLYSATMYWLTDSVSLTESQYRSMFAADSALLVCEVYRPELQADSTGITDKYVPSDWDGYHERTWAVNWYTWFTNGVTDARGKIGWAGHFAPLLNKQELDVYNFYSSGDEVFDEYHETPGITTGVFHWPTLNLEWPFFHLNWMLDAYPWQKQDVFNGVNAAGSLSAHYGKIYGLWEFADMIRVSDMFFNPTPNDTNLEDIKTFKESELRAGKCQCDKGCK